MSDFPKISHVNIKPQTCPCNSKLEVHVSSMLLWNSQLPVSININALSPFALKPRAAVGSTFCKYFKIKSY